MPVEFNEPEEITSVRPVKKSRGGITDFLIKKRWAKDQKEAERMLIILTVMVFLLAGFIFWRSLS